MEPSCGKTRGQDVSGLQRLDGFHCPAHWLWGRTRWGNVGSRLPWSHSVDESSRARFQFSASCFRKGLTPVSIQHKTCNILGAWKSRCILLLNKLLLFGVHFGGYHLRSGGQLLSIWHRDATLWGRNFSTSLRSQVAKKLKKLESEIGPFLARCNYGDMSGRLEGWKRHLETVARMIQRCQIGKWPPSKQEEHHLEVVGIATCTLTWIPIVSRQTNFHRSSQVCIGFSIGFLQNTRVT